MRPLRGKDHALAANAVEASMGRGALAVSLTPLEGRVFADMQPCRDKRLVDTPYATLCYYRQGEGRDLTLSRHRQLDQ